MKLAILFSAALLAGGIASAEVLMHEPFDYSAGDLTGGNGGSGWSGAWTESGNSTVVTGAGLSFTDSFGNVLHTSGGAVNTADGGAVTTISAREVADRNAETWISVLIQQQNDINSFVGVSFYDQSLDQANARFAIEHATGKNLRLVRRVAPVVNAAAFTTTVGTTVFAVLHLVPGGGAGATPDRIDVYSNPRLDEIPASPQASVQISGLQFDRVRLAGAAGRAMLVDELRIGESFADVTPYTPPPDPDTDGDGLLDSQEVVLGLDPNVSNAAFIAALRANAGWVALHTTDEIDGVSLGRVMLSPNGPANFDYSFEILDRQGLTLETITRSLPLSGDKQFFRLNLDTP
ncbi:hypothetical protein OKA05_26315 [Luteolibacter arcticus]|uniref:PEP-CTERM sorting domain-containing protein n=1 Tax=Luteolibacter arcticus TaxID=1581411 RepID=A0ABT3GRE7_9BACT|nr:hypothetical protein [Luteolibacter arcticus]MCW1926101.1 hypothetical protein [Luteolibacter arcticus]